MIEARSTVWEEAPDCGVCGSRASRAAGSICNRRYVTCSKCGVLRLLDRVAEGRLDLLYADYYPTADPSPQDLERQLENPTFHYRRERIEASLGTNERRILEVGCGDGNFLAVMRRGHWDVHGLEFSASTAEMVRRRHRIPVYVGEVSGISPERAFSVVAAYHVVEHVYHPVDWMGHVRRLIEPAGLLHLQTPNLAALSRYATGRAWAGMVFPQHVYLYTPRTLRSLLERSGFTVLTVTTWDPWHGPGVVANSLSQAAMRLLTGRLPWTDRLDEPAQKPVAPALPSSNRRPVRAAARRVVGSVSALLARVEAAVGHGSVVDIIARRREPSA